MDSCKIVSTFIEAVQRNGGTISPRTSPSVTAELETRLSFRLSYLYCELIDTYEFFPFEIGLLEFSGAFGCNDDPNDISCRLFPDPAFCVPSIAYAPISLCQTPQQALTILYA